MIYAENILICVAVPILISLVFIKGSTRSFAAAFLSGMLACLLSAYICGFIKVASGMSADDTSIFMSPVFEELMKFMPILFFLFMFMPSDKTLITVSIGVCAGFATFENFCYMLSSGTESLPFILIRGMAVGVMHVVSGLAVSLGLTMARRYDMLTLAGITGALGLSTIFHALYNLLVSESGISSVIGYALPIVTAAALYIAYLKLVSQGEE